MSIQVKILLFKNVKPVFQTFAEKLLIKNGANCKKAHTVLKFGKFRTENGNRKDRKWKLSWSSSISFGISKRWKLKKLSGLWKQNRRCSFYQIRFGPDQELSLHNTTKTILAIWIFKNLIFGFLKFTILQVYPELIF